MRQTSRAVALLLALDSVNAAPADAATQTAGNYNKWLYNTAFQERAGGSQNYAGAFTTGGRVGSRQAPYNSCPAWVMATGCPTGNTDKVGNWIAYKQATANAPGSSVSVAGATGLAASTSACVPCIQQHAVWCSRTFGHNLITGSVLQQNNATPANTSMLQYYLGTSGTNTYDNGSCCGLKLGAAGVNAFIAKIGAAATQTTEGIATTALNYNAWACVAFINRQKCGALYPTACPGTPAYENKFTASVVDIISVGNYKSWWCSNGIYLQTKDASDSFYQSKQLLPDNISQRYELALVGCPQLQTKCGAKTPLMTITATVADNTFTIVAAMTGNQKCTFVGKSVDKPPAFTINSGTTKPLNQAGNAGWVIHHMEYNNNQLVEVAAATAQYVAASQNNADTGTFGLPALDAATKIPQFTMGQAQYAKQRTWYGKGGSIYDMANWSSPYQNGAATTVTAYKGKQTYGSVAQFDSSTKVTDYDTDAAGTSITWDGRQVRYTPLQGIINSNAMGVKVASDFSAKKTEYDAAKTLWDNYVAILTKNAKVDAFAAAFSPPKAPTVPPLPAMPWVPAVTQTPYMAAASQVIGAVQGQTSATVTVASQPSSYQFWLADETPALASGGGWGSFTAALLTFRDKWGKSYGTIGYEDSTANTAYNAMGQVYNQHWQCGTTAVAGAAATACPLNYTSAATARAATPTINNVVNPTTFYVAVSIWTELSKDTTAYNFGTTTNLSEFSLIWTLGTWSTTMTALAAPASMAAPTAASTLSGVLGAQALAASAAAALATAAALY